MSLMLAAALAGGAKLGGGILSLIQRGEYANLLEDQNKTIPEAITRAEGIHERLADVGLPGADEAKSDVDENVANMISQASRVVDSPQALVDALVGATESANESKTNINVQDQRTKLSNMNRFAAFLSQAKAPAEMRVEDFNIQKTLGAKRERMQGWADLLQGVEGAAGTMATGFANKKYHEYLNSKLAAMKSAWEEDQDQNSGYGKSKAKRINNMPDYDLDFEYSPRGGKTFTDPWSPYFGSKSDNPTGNYFDD